MIIFLFKTGGKPKRFNSYAQYMLFALFAVFMLSGCGAKQQLTLMPTPVIYHNSAIDPFAHLATHHKSTKSQVFYATNRVPIISGDTLEYGNGIDQILHVGQATVRMGDLTTEWEDLYKYSLADSEITPVLKQHRF